MEMADHILDSCWAIETTVLRGPILELGYLMVRVDVLDSPLKNDALREGA